MKPSLTPRDERISDVVARWASESPDAEALVLGDCRITYADLHQRIDALARALLHAGVRKGDRIAVMTTPHPDAIVTFLAAASVGAIFVGLNPRFRQEELRQVVADAEPVLLFARTRIEERSYVAEIEQLRGEGAFLRNVVVLARDPPMNGAESYEEFVARAASLVGAERLREARAQCGGRDPCLLVYTSGSTGRPKGALLHHQGLIEFARAQNRAWPVSTPRFLNYFPINHIGSLVDVSYPALVGGGCVVFLEHFSALESMKLIERERITVWAAVPSAFQLQLALPQFQEFDLSAVELIVWEGGAMPLETLRQLREICPRLATNYGMTEATSAITIVLPTDDVEVLANSVGDAFAGVQIRLVDADGAIVPEGAAGEVQARSIYNMLGYWGRPRETAEALLPDGWLRTGDLAVRRPDGRYRLIGRLKEMFKSGGYNVYPQEVERVIETHPAVQSAAVVGCPDPLWQEIGVAYVVARQPVTGPDLQDYCRSRLAHYKIPKRFVLCADLPLLPIGKVDKVALRHRAQELHHAS